MGKKISVVFFLLVFCFTPSLCLAKAKMGKKHTRRPRLTKRQPRVAPIANTKKEVPIASTSSLFSAGSKAVETKRLFGWTPVGLFSTLSGLRPAPLQRVENISPLGSLGYMLSVKNIRSRNRPDVVEVSNVRYEEYKTLPSDFIEITAFLGRIDKQIKLVNQNFNWNFYEKLAGLTLTQTNLVKSLTENQNARNLTAYVLTEFMPSSNGKQNLEFYKFLLENYGTRYVYSVPAMFDKEISFGVLQFTKYALCGQGCPRLMGASIPNLALPPNLRIPNQVADLRGDDHYKAGYLLTLYNFSELVKLLNPAELEILQTNWVSHQDDLVVFMATSHHAPNLAYSGARSWIASGMSLPLTNFLKGRARTYGLKTMSNLKALEEDGLQAHPTQFVSVWLEPCLVP